MNFTSFVLATTTTASSASTSASANLAEIFVSLLPIILIFVVFYFILIRPQHKRDKQTAKMRSEIQVGDEVTTVGGIVGRVVTIKDDTLVIESGADRNKIRIKKWAVQSNETVHDQ